MIKEMMLIGLLGTSYFNPAVNEENHKKAEIYTYFAFDAVNRKDYDFAIDNLEKALQLEENAENRKLLGGCYGGIGDNKKALIELEKSLELNPKDLELADKLGKSYIILKEYDKAIVKFDYLAKEIPDSPLAFNELGVICNVLGKFEKARDYYEVSVDNCIKLGFAHPQILFNTAVNYYDLHKESKNKEDLISSMYYYCVAGSANKKGALNNAEQIYAMLIHKNKKDWNEIDNIKFKTLGINFVNIYLEQILNHKEKENERLEKMLEKMKRE